MNDRVQRLVHHLRRDVAATIGPGFDDVVKEWAASRVAIVGADHPRFEEDVVNDLQQYFHDARVDTTWPRCPHHPNHPLWFSGGWWRCEQRGEPVARLGELAPR